MSKWDKIIKRICSLPSDMRFEELRLALEKCGYKMSSPKRGSSHFTFRKKGCASITIPKHEPIKKIYIQLVKNIIESEDK